MSNKNDINPSKVQAEDQSIAIGSIDIGGNVSGDITIGHKIGYTSEQVSALLTQISTTFQPKPFDGRCPYKGLDFFEEVDAELFFGREKLVYDLVERVKESRTVFITGPSGSGKSSLVRAGLIHALKQGAIKESHSERWLYATLKPGREPFEALALAFSRLKSPDLAKYFRENLSNPDVIHQCAESALSDNPGQRLVMFIDQFEEVFTQLSTEKAGAFIHLITNAAGTKNGRVTLLFAMRSDFVSNCAAFPELNALLNKQFVQIGAMQPDELVSAIAQPALRVGLRIDPDLIAQIINDMQGEPGALPLMQFALKDLFETEQASGGMIALTREAYLHRGGIQKSLERHADASFGKLDKHEQELAHAIFSGLIEVGRGTQDTRRTAMFDELIPADAKESEIQSIVKKLADARLITTDEVAGKDTVTISHEKLIEAWPWLKKLVDENRDVIALQNQITEDAKEWEEHRQDESYLYSGARLAFAEEQVTSQKILLSGLAKDFIAEGINLREEARKSKELLRRRITIGLTSGITIALFLAGFAIYQILQAQKQAQITRAGELSAVSIALRDKNFPVSLLLGIEAYREFPSVQSEGAVLDNAQANPLLRQYLALHEKEVFSVAFSPDGKTLASGSRDEKIILWNVESHEPIGQPLEAHTGSVTSVVFSPNGAILASASVDNTIILWDVASRKPINSPLTGHEKPVYSVAFSPDGKILASGGTEKIILWDVVSHQPVGQPLVGHEKYISSIAFSPDGKFLASGSADGTIIFWDVESHKPIDQPLVRHEGAITSIAFNKDGNILASGSVDRTIILWSVETRQPIAPPLAEHENVVNSVAFSPDGKTLLSGSVDRTIILWNVEKVENPERLGEPLTGHSNWVRSVAFSPDGQTFASGGKDNMVILWDMNGRSSLGQFLTGHNEHIYSVAFSHDGKLLASGGKDNKIILWDVASRKPIGQPLLGHSDWVNSVAFSPDSRVLASGSSDGTIILWDVASREPINSPLTGHEKPVYSVAFSPDGKILASGGADNKIILWDMVSRAAINTQLIEHDGPVNSLAFSPDGKTLASGGTDKVILWDVDSQEPIGHPLKGHTGLIYSIAFSPGGEILASSSQDSTIILWNVDTQQPINSPLVYQSGFIYSIAFSPDGKTLASGSYENSIQLWDVENIESVSRLGEPFLDNTMTISSLAFGPDGKSLVSGGADNSVILWDLDPKNWIERTCQRIGRNLTPDEWALYFPNEEYRVTCPQ